MILQKHPNYQPCDTALHPRKPTLNDLYKHSYLHFRSLILFMPTSPCSTRWTAPHKEAHNMTINQWTIWLFTVPHQPAYCGKKNWHSLTSFNWTWILVHIHTQPHHRHIIPLNANLNPISHLLALFGARHILHVSRIRINPLPVQFKAVLRGQKGCVFFSGHLNLPTRPEIGLPSREKNHNN